MSMSMNVNIHHPQIQPGVLGVYRNGTDRLVVSLNSTESYGGTVTLFLSDQEFDAIVDAVNAYRREHEPSTDELLRKYLELHARAVAGDSEAREVLNETDVLDTEREQFSTIAVCEECGDTEVLGNLRRGLCYPCDRKESNHA